MAGKASIILLADDDQVVREMLAVALRRAGYPVLLARHGQEAVGYLRQAPELIRAVVTDIEMPFLSGVEVAEAAERVAGCPVVLMSGRPEKAPCLEDKGWRFLAKPFTPDILIRMLQELSPDRGSDSIRPRVIVAEDDAEVRRRLVSLLQGEYEVVAEVESGEAALHKAEQLHPEMVLLDIRMPGINGFAVARMLHQSMPDVPLVFVTQHSDRTYVEEAFAAGVAGYILKKNVVTELGPALQRVRSGERYLSPGLEAC